MRVSVSGEACAVRISVLNIISSFCMYGAPWRCRALIIYEVYSQSLLLRFYDTEFNYIGDGWVETVYTLPSVSECGISDCKLLIFCVTMSKLPIDRFRAIEVCSRVRFPARVHFISAIF